MPVRTSTGPSGVRLSLLAIQSSEMPGSPTKITPELARELLDAHDAGESFRVLAAKTGASKSVVARHVARARARRDEARAERAEVEALRREAREAERRAEPPPPTDREAELIAAVNAATPGSPEHTTAKLWLKRYRRDRPRYVPLPSLTGQPVEPVRTPSRHERPMWANPYER